MNKMKGHGGRPKVSVSAPTAKDIKEAAWNRSLRLYVMNPERMQAFEEAICEEQRLNCLRKVDFTQRWEIISEQIISAPKPEL